MQKFTVFSILLSISIVLMIGDIVFHDYLSQFRQEEIKPLEESDTLQESSEESSELESSVLLSEETEEQETEAFEPQSETASDVGSMDGLESTAIVNSSLGTELFEKAGFSQPVLKNALFSGLIFQFISFSDQTEATVYQWNLFDGENYVGSVYEMKYTTETGSFQGYLALRERAMSLTELGTVNEVNNYGDASFYFNHKNKTKTVHLIMRSGGSLYAFEYGQSHHETMKKVFDILSPFL